jgi:hypothetical protein
VSKVRIVKGKSLNIPISLETKFDITGQEDLIEKFSDDVLQDIINPVKDYEVSKFIHNYDESGDNGLYIAASFIDHTKNDQFWIDEYYPQGFNKEELVLFSNAVKNSFFKLDFFDTTSRERQKLQLTKIIPMYLSNLAIYDVDYDGTADYEDTDVNGEDMVGGVNLESSDNWVEYEVEDEYSNVIRTGYEIKEGYDDKDNGEEKEFYDRFESSQSLKPTQTGTYIVPNLYSNNVKNNEISDLFVFKSLETKPFNEFYMSCRFFNAKTGNVVRMTNDPLIDSGINPKKDFYYKVKLDRQKLTYEIYEYSDGVEGERVGDSEDNPLMFYQML